MAVTQSQNINLVVDQGADFSKNLTVTTDGSTAYDISGRTFNAQMRPSYDSSTLTATFTASIVTATSGIYKSPAPESINAYSVIYAVVPS